MITSPASETSNSGPSFRHVVTCLAIALLALAISLLVFSPHLWLMREHVSGSFQWARAEGFMLQCAEPLRRDVEPALHWRLLPPMLCHALGLQGRAALIFPWIGLLAMLSFASHAIYSRIGHWRPAALMTIMLGTTSAVISSTNFFGINDGWNWLGLLLVAYARPSWVLPLVAIIFPWCDERVVIGFPLALVVRALDRESSPRWQLLVPLAWLIPYFAVRLFFIRDPSTQLFLGDALKDSLQYVAFAPLGWWMAFRAGWIAIGAALVFSPPAWRWWTTSLLILTLVVVVALAADLSRSAAIVCPLMLLGCLILCRRWPGSTYRIALVLCVANAVIPAAHVVHTKIDLVSPLPIELFRLVRHK